MNWTAEKYREVTGREPVDDDLERVNCPKAGEFGHSYCGVCPHDRPKHDCMQCALDRGAVVAGRVPSSGSPPK